MNTVQQGKKLEDTLGFRLGVKVVKVMRFASKPGNAVPLIAFTLGQLTWFGVLVAEWLSGPTPPPLGVVTWILVGISVPIWITTSVVIIRLAIAGCKFLQVPPMGELPPLPPRATTVTSQAPPDP